MRTIWAALLLLAGLAGSGGGAETNEQKGKRVADEALAALGGQAFLAVRDRTESGRAYQFYREKISGLAIAYLYTRYLANPESPEPGSLRMREREAFGKKQDDVVLFTQGAGYELTFRGARPLSDLDDTAVQGQHSAQRLLHPARAPDRARPFLRIARLGLLR